MRSNEETTLNPIYLFGFLALILFSIILFLPVVQGGLLDDALSPLMDLDFETFYAKYWGVIDAIIFTIIFVGLAQLTLGRKFGEGRGSRALVVGVGVALALALVATEQQMGFSLIQFGPYAASIFVILAASVLYYLLKILGIGGTSSFATSYVVIYFLLRSVIPNFFGFLQHSAPGLHALISLGALIALFFAVWKLVIGFWPGGPVKIQDKIKKVKEKPFKSLRARAELGEQEKIFSGKLADIQKKRVKDSGSIIHDLDNILLTIDQYGDNLESRKSIANILEKDVIPRERNLHISLRALTKLFNRVRKFELGMLADLKNLPPAKQKAVENEVKVKLRKLNVEERIKYFTDRIEHHEKFFRNKMAQAVQLINAGRMDQAKEPILEAKEGEQRIVELDKELQELVAVLHSMTRGEIVKGT